MTTISGSQRQASYDKLETWLRAYAGTAIDMPQARVSLGSNASYFASSPAGGVACNRLPASFESLFNPQQPARVPTHVSLGVQDTWFALWPDGNSSCYLGDEYPNLETLLRKHGTSGVNVRNASWFAPMSESGIHLRLTSSYSFNRTLL